MPTKKIDVLPPQYYKRLKFKGWNGPVNVLNEHRLFSQILPNLSHADHERLAREFAEKASKSNADWTRAIDAAVKKYGDGDGRLISGIYRNHFPESVKAKLRALAWATSDLHSASFAHYKASGKRAPYPYTIR